MLDSMYIDAVLCVVRLSEINMARSFKKASRCAKLHPCVPLPVPSLPLQHYPALCILT